MANYTKTTDFAAKDTLPGGDTNKVVRGTEFETEFDAISTAIATKADTASPTFTGTVTVPTADINGGNIDGTVIGASTAAAGTFTDLTTSGTLNLTGLSVTFSQLDAGAVTLSSETFSDVDNQIPTNAAVIDYVAATIPSIAEVNDLSAVVTWANVPDANITQSSVTQHQAALSVTASQLSDVTSTAAELNLLDGSTANTVVNSKAVVYGSGGQIAATSYTGDGSALTGIEAAPSLTATASGAIANGDPVIMNSNGTVSKPTGQNFAVSAKATASGSDRATECSVIFDPNANKSLVVYRNQDQSNYLYGVVATVASDGAITYGTPVAIDETGSTSPHGGVFDPDTNQVVIHWSRSTGTAGMYAAVCSISGTTFTFGTAVQYDTNTAGSNSKKGICYDTTNDKVVIAYRDSTTAGRGIVGTVSGTSISFGSTTNFSSAQINYPNAVFDTTNEKVVVVWEDASSHDPQAVVGTVSGTSISFGTQTELVAGNAEHVTATYDPDSGKVLVAFQDTAEDMGPFMVGTVSGTDISFTDPGGYIFEDGNTTTSAHGPVYNRMVYDTNINKPVIFYWSRWSDPENSATNYLKLYAKAVTINSSTGVPTFAKAQLIAENPPYATTNANYNYTLPAYNDFDVDFDSNVNKFIVVFQDPVANGDTSYRCVGYSVTIGNSTLTSENFVGISNGSYADTATATIQLTGAVDDAQSGLTAGTGYYVGLDGSFIADSTQLPSVFAGVATSATNLLIKG